MHPQKAYVRLSELVHHNSNSSMVRWAGGPRLMQKNGRGAFIQMIMLINNNYFYVTIEKLFIKLQLSASAKQVKQTWTINCSSDYLQLRHI
jgi:hypothetical protein